MSSQPICPGLAPLLRTSGLRRVFPGAARLCLLLWIAAAVGVAPLWAQETAEKPPMKYAIAIHGGAGSLPADFTDEANQLRRASMEKALRIGVGVLEQGGTALDAVEQVVVHLEDDPQFNAGRGSVFNAAGGHELDASIMDGSNRGCGAVAGVTCVKNPVKLARLVMTQSPHVMMAGAGAEAFAREMKVELVDPAWFDTPRTRAAWERTRERQSQWRPGQRFLPSAEDIGTSAMGTVGCVALDAAGNLAAATSTGGMSNKKYGRVGDSPIIGAGTFAENATVAVSCTGNGEEFIRFNVAAEVAARVRQTGCTAEEAVRFLLEKTLQPDDGGIIAVSRTGEITMQFSTAAMARAAADSNGRFEVHWADPPADSGNGSAPQATNSRR